MPLRISIFLVCLCAALSGLYYVIPKQGDDSNALIPNVLAGTSQPVALEDLSSGDFRREFLETVNPLRKKRGYPELAADPAIQKWLDEGGSGISCNTLQPAIAAANFPDFRSLRAAGATGELLQEMLPGFIEKMADAPSATDNRFAFLIRPLPGHGQEVILVSAEALPELTLAQLGENPVNAFVSQCPHCAKRSSFQYEKSSSTLVLICPGCGLCSRLMGRDTKGKYHDAPAFLIPSPFPTVSDGTHPLDAMISIWQTAVRRCQYMEDNTPDETATDSWQTPRQTLAKKTGDCEDSALLLTDWMLSNNIPARMALGTMDGGGHAWCIVKADGTDYLLESTNRNPDLENLPAVNPNDGYVPSALFDRDALYVRAQPKKPFDGDYWSKEKWIRLPHKKAASHKTKAATETKMALKP